MNINVYDLTDNANLVQNLIPQLSIKEINKSLQELKNNDLVSYTFGSNEPVEICLSKIAIKAFKNN